jgi:hypothetical protein
LLLHKSRYNVSNLRLVDRVIGSTDGSIVFLSYVVSLDGAFSWLKLNCAVLVKLPRGATAAVQTTEAGRRSEDKMFSIYPIIIA